MKSPMLITKAIEFKIKCVGIIYMFVANVMYTLLYCDMSQVIVLLAIVNVLGLKK